jgi:hypothetical protein
VAYSIGQVTINVRSEKVVTHGLYLMVYGQEAFRSYDAARNVPLFLFAPL